MALVAEAAKPAAPGFDPTERLANELRRTLGEIPADRVPAGLRDALASGAAVGPDAAQWLPPLRQWLADECVRSEF